MSRRVILTPSPRSQFAPEPGQTIVVPNNHVARQLQIAGCSLEDLARMVLLSRGLTPASGLALQRALTAAIQEDPGWPSHDPDGSARAVAHSVNLLFRAGADLDAVAGSGDARMARLARAASEARRRLDASGLVAASDSLGRAAALNPFPAPLCIYGYARLSSLECDFVDTAAGDGSVLILPFSDSPIFKENQDAAQRLARSGWLIERRSASAADHLGDAVFECFLDGTSCLDELRAYSYPTAESEVRAALAQIKAALVDGEYAASDVVLVLRNEKLYGPILQSAAWEYELPVETHYAVSLRETRLGAWLLLLLDSVDTGELPFESTAWLLQHPLSRRLITETFSTEGWPGARRIHAHGVEWGQFGALLDGLTWPQTATRHEWTELIMNVLNELNVHFLARERAQDIEARSALLAAMPDLSSPPDEVLSRESFIAQMRDLIALTEIGASEASGGIAVHTPLALYGTAYKHVFVLGMIDEILPASIRDDPYLDFAARKELAESGAAQLESAAEAARREQLSFAMLLLTPSETLHLSLPRQIEGGEAVPSPYLRKFGLETRIPAGIGRRPYRIDLRDGEHLAAPPIAASALDTLPVDLLADDPGSLTAAYAKHAYGVLLRRERGVHDEYSGLIGEPFDTAQYAFSPTEITHFGQCAFRWFAMGRLGLRDPDEAEDDLAGREKGMLFHSALADAVPDSPHSDVRAAILERLEAALDAAIAKQPSVTRIAGWSARRSELLSVLRRAVEQERFLLPEARIVLTEAAFRGEWEGLRVRGRIDRLDEIDGRLYIVDYKTSGNSQFVKDENGELEVDVQLPLYIHFGHRAAGRTDAADGGYYYALNDGKALHPINLPESKHANTVNTEALSRLAASIKDAAERGDYPVNPDPEQKACAYCEFDVLCRRGPHLARRRGEEE